MKYSFIIPTYNRGRILLGAIESILRQKGQHDFEILICDDGSKDNTREIVENLKDPKIKYFYQENQGPSVARNLGLANADGEWVVYLDSDNTLLPDYLNTIEKYLNHNKEVLYALPKQKRILEIVEDGGVVESKDFSDQSSGHSALDYYGRLSYADTNGLLHHRVFIDLGCQWDKNLMGIEDWEFFMQLVEQKPENFLYIDEPLVVYTRRVGKGSDGIVSGSTFDKWKKDCEYIYKKHKYSKFMTGQIWYPPKEQDFESWVKNNSLII